MLLTTVATMMATIIIIIIITWVTRMSVAAAKQLAKPFNQFVKEHNN
ncbi:hypothetical protein HHL17_29530 [Chitinophaga sp. G-6-1-13]|uniref:Uncharacterized protein n=1 Tax=Chitinophaga fulva TaxID=2728842 RepID=A0A848GXB4_9BACT|nr:hypothetical protein [Chitinophaga fulva]NML41370.1 hypothetical protein [Chitinophaga fulva]